MDFSLPEVAHPLEQILMDCKTALRYMVNKLSGTVHVLSL
jgi:hypothetical protein